MSDEKPMGQVIQIDETQFRPSWRDGTWHSGGDVERHAGC